MATLVATSDPDHRAESDYGSDFSLEEESIVTQLLDKVQESQKGNSAESIAVLQVDLEAAIAADVFASSPLNEGDNDAVSIIHPVHSRVECSAYGLAKTHATPLGRNARSIRDSIRSRPLQMDGISYPNLSRVLSKLESDSAAATMLGSSSTVGAQLEAPKLPAEDLRSPIERFRSFPRKPLTVTDISSGAWCELQYWYTLTRLPGGRKTRTAAMRSGTKVHKELEDEVHTTVQVNIASKEEAFALRLWNIIQGLRTLRDTGFTRELEVWGFLEGQVINGIIDEISYTSPNAGFEEELSQIHDGLKRQSSISTYFSQRRRVYLTDVKTRGVNNLPSGAALRPSKVQLTLYHRLLTDMAAGKLDFSVILTRYGLKSDAQFSDAFIAQIGSLRDELFGNSESDGKGPGAKSPTDTILGRSPDSSPNMRPPTSATPDLIRYRSLQYIIPLLETELRDTFPQGAETLGDVVGIQYRHREDGHIIGNQVFPADEAALDKYVKLNLGWWLGKREAEGVPIEEAYKCRSCEFAETCEWRNNREEEFFRKSSRPRFFAKQEG